MLFGIHVVIDCRWLEMVIIHCVALLSLPGDATGHMSFVNRHQAGHFADVVGMAFAITACEKAFHWEWALQLLAQR